MNAVGGSWGRTPATAARPSTVSPGPAFQGLGGTPAGLSHAPAAALSMYEVPPCQDITLDDFERLALERIRVLKSLEDLKLRGRPDVDLQAAIKELSDRQSKAPLSVEDEAQQDVISHYILRLSYCRTAELRKWLLTQETELFRLRFSRLLPSEQEAFLVAAALPFAPVPEEEYTPELKEQLMQVLAANLEKADAIKAQLEHSMYYKVHFTAVPDLVSRRRVLLKRGTAYVSRTDVASLVLGEFRSRLSKGLSDVSRHWRTMFPEGDMRLRPLVASLSQRYLGADYSSAAGKHADVTAANLPALAQRHFPLCASRLMTTLAGDRHLRHAGRQQLGLFLKGIGLSMEEALIFWRTSFAPRITHEAFDKEYAYNVRHNYGREGKRTEYSAHNCLSLVRMSGGAGEAHGCPYKRADEATLRASLRHLKCDDKLIDEAVSKARGGHYQIACACAFEGIHGTPTDLGISHPLQYYTESRRLADVAAGVTAPAATAAGATAPVTGGSGSAITGMPAGAARPGSVLQPGRAGDLDTVMT